MRISGLRTMHADGGWRALSYLRLETDTGLGGWAGYAQPGLVGGEEYFESAWSPGLTGVVESLEPRVLGRDPQAFARLSSDLRAMTRISAGGLGSQAIATVENACIDLAGKAVGLPAYALFGGPVRDRIRTYWSHCGSFRATRGDLFGPPPLDGIESWVALGREVRERGYTAAKTNP